jgi:hypothetical protein
MREIIGKDGIFEPQDLFPDQHRLFSRFCVEVREQQETLPGRPLSRFCVEVPRASTCTTTDGLASTTVTAAAAKAKSAVGAVTALTAKAKSAVGAVTAKTKSMVFGSGDKQGEQKTIRLCVVKWDGESHDRWDPEHPGSTDDWVLTEHEIDKSKSIYEQINANLNSEQSWKRVDVISERFTKEGYRNGIISWYTVKTDKIKFDAECKKLIAKADKPFSRIRLRVQARDEKLVREVASEKKAREDSITPEMRQTDLRQREITRLWRMTDDAVKKEESYMGEKSKDAYFKKFGLARSPWELKKLAVIENKQYLRDFELTSISDWTLDEAKKVESKMDHRDKDNYFAKFGAHSPWELKTSEAKYFSKYGVKYPWEPGKDILAELG